MEYDDIVKLLSTPETLKEGLVELADYDKARAEKLGAMQEEINDKNNKIDELRGTNARLYARITGDPEPEQEEDDRPEFDKLLEKIKENERNGNNN